MLERPLLTLVLRNLFSSSLCFKTDPRIELAEFLHKFSNVSCCFRSISIHVVTLVFSSEHIQIHLDDLFFSNFISTLDFNTNISVIINSPSFTCPFSLSRITNVELSCNEDELSLSDLFSTFNFPFLSSLTIAGLLIDHDSFSAPSPFFPFSLHELTFHQCHFTLEELVFGDHFNQIKDFSIIFDYEVVELTLLDLSNCSSLIKLEISFDSVSDVEIRGTDLLSSLQHLSLRNVVVCSGLHDEAKISTLNLSEVSNEVVENLFTNISNFEHTKFSLNSIDFGALYIFNPKISSIGYFNELFGLSSDHNDFISNISFKFIETLKLNDLEHVNIDLKFSKFLDELTVSLVDHETTTFSLPDCLFTSLLSLSQVDPNICLEILRTMPFLVELDIDLIPNDPNFEPNISKFEPFDSAKSIKFDYLRELRINSPLPIFDAKFPRLRELCVRHNNFDLFWLYEKFPKLLDLSLSKCRLTNSQNFPSNFSHPLTNFAAKFSSLVDFDFSQFFNLNRVTLFSIDKTTKIILPFSLQLLSIFSHISLFKENSENWKLIKKIKGSFFPDFGQEELVELQQNYQNLELDMQSINMIDFEMFKNNFVGAH
ncbi:hypothetical protein RCL1_008293 [Eukaryota sp. TZLM3-RCL]